MKIDVVEPTAEILTPPIVLATFPHMIELAGRTCYKSGAGKETAGPFIRRLIKRGHLSVLEHCSVTVRITCSRACSHQLVRHRLGAYSQESQRYCDYDGKGLRVVVPLGTRTQPGVYDRSDIYDFPTFLQGVAHAYATYCTARQDGMRSEDARYHLPNATATEVVTTYNLRQWRHVFAERALNPRAQWEIRSVMYGLLGELADYLPDVFGDLAGVWSVEQ